MKNILIYTITAGMMLTLLQSCGPSEEDLRLQQREREQVRLDSLERVWEEEMAQLRRDSINQAQQRLAEAAVAEVSEPEPDAPVVRYDPNGPFAVQVRSWRSEERAQRQVTEWNRRGFDHVYVQQYGNEETGDVWFRVRIGNVNSFRMATLLKNKLKNEFNTDSWIATAGESPQQMSIH